MREDFVKELRLRKALERKTMDKCNANCEYMELLKDELKGKNYENIETGGYCEKHKKGNLDVR